MDTTDPGPPLPHQVEQFHLLEAQVALLDDEEKAPGQPEQIIFVFHGVPAWTTGPKHYMTAMAPDSALAWALGVVETAKEAGAERVESNGILVAQSMDQAKSVAEGMDRIRRRGQ